MTPMFAPAHELSRQIQIINAFCREAEHLRDPIHDTLWDVLDELMEAHAQIAPRSLFAGQFFACPPLVVHGVIVLSLRTTCIDLIFVANCPLIPFAMILDYTLIPCNIFCKIDGKEIVSHHICTTVMAMEREY